MTGSRLALPRLLARLAGREVRRGEWSAREAYGFGAFVFAFACVGVGRAFWPIVRPGWGKVIFFVVLPFGVWLALLLLYYLNSLAARLLRRLGLYSAKTNNPLQHVVIMSLLTLLAAWFLDGPGWLRTLGILWFALLGLNLLALAVLKCWHEP